MNRWLRGAAVATFGLSLAVVSPASARADAPESLRIKADRAMSALLQGGCSAAPSVFETVVADAGFGTFDDETRAALLGGAAVCAMSGGDVQTAYGYARRGAEEPAADSANWSVRLTLALASGRPADAASSLQILAARHPAALKEITSREVAAVYSGLGGSPDAEGARLAVLDALSTAGWRSEDPVDSGDALRLEHVRLLLAAGRADEARGRARAIGDPVQLLSLDLDRRFETARRPEPPDVRRAAQDALIRARVASAAAPDRLSGPVAMAGLHLALGEPELALRVLDAALKRQRQGGEAAFEDAETQGTWADDLRAQALFALGRFDLGVAAVSETTDADDFSRVVNLAGVLTFVGRASEASTALDALDPATLPMEGRAWVEAARACALAADDRTGPARASADTVDALAPRGLQARTHARLCVGDLDTAAALYAQRLGDPDTRLSALLALQTWRQGAALERSPWGVRRREQLATLRARADVRSAVSAAGGRIGPVDLVDVHGRL